MRQITAILSVAAVVLMAAGVVAQAKPSFAGEWKIVVVPPDGGGGRGGGPGIDLTITQDATVTAERLTRPFVPSPRPPWSGRSSDDFK